jgi:hypothetical protein
VLFRRCIICHHHSAPACVVCCVQTGFGLYLDNARAPTQDSVPSSLFYGFSAAALGISGFETSANFIEEQKSGVFPKTLRNMWIGSLIFNPVLCFLAIGTGTPTPIFLCCPLPPVSQCNVLCCAVLCCCAALAI